MIEGMESHFIVNTVNGVMIALCGKVVRPHDFNTARVGKVFAESCAVCETRSDQAWVSFTRI